MFPPGIRLELAAAPCYQYAVLLEDLPGDTDTTLFGKQQVVTYHRVEDPQSSTQFVSQGGADRFSGPCGGHIAFVVDPVV